MILYKRKSSVIYRGWYITEFFLSSITKRCTECFILLALGILDIFMFQSPNGVQNAFWHGGYSRWRVNCFNHQTVYRMLWWLCKMMWWCSVSITKRCTECFRETLEKAVKTYAFQSPNGVQNAFYKYGRIGIINGSFNHQTVYRML